MAMLPEEHRTPTPNHGLGFTSISSGEIQDNGNLHNQDVVEALAFAKRILLEGDHSSIHSRTASTSSSASLEHARPHSYASQDSPYLPQAGPSSPSARSPTAPPIVPPRRRSRGSSSLHGSSNSNDFTKHRQTISTTSSSGEKQALAKLVGMYENLTSEMSHMLSRQAELETSLKIARSNLALAENHAEALEDTLKRNSQSRLSNGTGNILRYSPVPPPVPGFANSASPVPSSSGTVRSASRSPNPPQGYFGNLVDTPDSDPSTIPSPRLGSFWKRKAGFGQSSHESLAHQQDSNDHNTSKRSSSSLGIHPVRAINGVGATANHSTSYEIASEDESIRASTQKTTFGLLRSASSAVSSNSNDKAQSTLISSLQNQLAQSKQSYIALQSEFQLLQQKHAGLSEKYTSLQDEIENLSVSLFEEANSMVAEERKVNSFLNEQLDKAKEEADDLQRQVDDLKTTLAEKERLASPPLSRSSHRRRTSTSSHHTLSHPSRNRRRSSIAALDAIETFVTSSPRRASRDLAAAAAAVRSLGQSYGSADMPALPRSASASSFARSMLSVSQPAQSTTSSFSAPSSAALPEESPDELLQSSALQITTEVAETSDESPAYDQTGQIQASANSADSGDDQSEFPPLSATSTRSRWFSFGSRRRPKIEAGPSLSPRDLSSQGISTTSSTASPVEATSPAVRDLAAPRLPPRLPPRSPDRNLNHSRLNSSFSPEMFKPGLPRVNEGSSSPRMSPTTSLTSNVQHLVSPSARSDHMREQLSSSARNTPVSRPVSPFSQSGTDSGKRSSVLNRSLSAFSSPASRRPGTGPRELILLSGGSATNSPRSATASPRRENSFARQQQPNTRSQNSPLDSQSPANASALPRSPSFPRYMPVSELHSILDQISVDDSPPSFNRLALTEQGRTASAIRLQSSSLRIGEEKIASGQAQPSAEPSLESLGAHKKSNWSISSDRSYASTAMGDRPTSRLSSRVILPDDSNVLAEEHTGQQQAELRTKAAVLDTQPLARRQRPDPIVTRGAPATIVSGANQGASSPFGLPTPPVFKRFPRDGSYRAPLHSPSQSEALLMQQSKSNAKNSSRDLQRSGSTASDASFNLGFDPSRYGLQRQNSNMSVASGNVAEDLDTLMRSIDAISESLGLEGDSIDLNMHH